MKKILIILLFLISNNFVFSQIDTIRLNYGNNYSCTERNITFYLRYELAKIQTEKQNYTVFAISPNLSSIKIIEMIVCYNERNCFLQKENDYINELSLVDEKPSQIYTYYGYLPWEIYIVFRKYRI